MTPEDQKAWDLFAAASLTGLLAAETKDHKYLPDPERGGLPRSQKLARQARNDADAMMAERGKEVKL